MDRNSERRVPLVRLFECRGVLKRLASFEEPVDRCNFNVYTGWGGRTYIADHGIDEYKPTLKGTAILSLYSVKYSDSIVLTEEQYKDYNNVSGLE